MPKGVFTQGVVVLLAEPPPLERVSALLQGRAIAGTTPGDTAPTWMGHHPAVVIDVEPAVNGKVVVDVVAAPWPDHMGDPKGSPEEVALFSAWSLGMFGPFTFPGGLQRAAAYCFRWGEAEGRAAIDRHRAFLRVRSSYVIDTAGGPVDLERKVVPPDYDAEAELETVTKVACDLLALPEALAYFDPTGEVLLSRTQVQQSLTLAFDHTLPPLELWANARVFDDGDWTVMDLVGMRQLDQDDHEACFPRGAFDLQDIHGFLRNATFHVLEQGPVINDGDAVIGAGGVHWRARACSESLSAPPRPTLRWFPTEGPPPPERLLAGVTPP